MKTKQNMTQFVILFHHFPIPENDKPSPQQLEQVNNQWQQYIGGVAAKDLLISVQRFEQEGTIIDRDEKSTSAIETGKGLLVGTLTVQAENLKAAIALTKGCPIFSIGGTVEVRPVAPFNA